MKAIKQFGLSVLAFTPMMAFADFDAEGTDYSKDEQEYHIWNESLQPIELVNSILCFTAQMRASEFVNQGPYMVLADESRCFDNEDDSGNQSSGSENVPSYMQVTVDAKKDSEEDPLVVSVWIPGMSVGEDDEAIKFKAVITEGVTDENPFGNFTFNFDFYDTIDSAERRGGGEVKTINDVDGHIGFTLYEENQDEGFQSSQKASVIMAADRTSGSAITASSWGSESRAFALTFNDNHVLVQSGDTPEELDFREGDHSGSCLNRTQFNDTVWRYDLYDADDGSRIDIDSGFSFRYDSDNDDVPDRYGHVGYWGLWTDGDEGLENGTPVEVMNFDNDSTETYTVVSAPGRLIKRTVESLLLTEIVGVEFFHWDDTAFQQNYDTWGVRYMTTEEPGVEQAGFYRVAGIRWGDQGPEREAVTPVRYDLQTHELLHLYSDELGGDANYKQGDDKLTFFKESFMSGNESDFVDGKIDLHCVDRCPVGLLEAADLADWDSPHLPYVENLNDAHAYRIRNTGDDFMTLVRVSNNEKVRYAENLTEQALADSPHQWGMRTGAMVTSATLASMSNPHEIYSPEHVDVVYMWETGMNSWNHHATVKDESGDIKSFEKPLQMIYRHSDANDRTGDAGEFDGKTIMLSYGGQGDLWGIPHVQIEQSHSRPAFNLRDGVVMGAQDQYVVKAREIEGIMASADGQCSEMELSEPSVGVPSSVTGSADIGPMPVVTAAPAVIGGELQDSSEEESNP